ncbi:signal recognition particle-docking protein FtsY [Dethiobacter alkaliphilus]|uniref:Signal recognition particle receptor FtsY n=1 Tax=Dethiobacter alkaliphilus AHT 1 TaxID=555088 RepID=C0GHL4_DETAL|nr:signal recognition particle-docking protein FtsY [Dethiobacter alkaliphilus]EEG77220.1 signal recognition particle-docking protein FtsY [Dethiobacter alkaliphilus AHT 1]
MGIFSRIKEGLKKTRSGIMGRMEGLFARSSFDDEFYEELEEVLIGADVGVETTMQITDSLREKVREEKAREPQQVMDILKGLLLDILGRDVVPLELSEQKPTVILVLGVNGVGKTTTIGKLAHRYKNEGKKVLLAAGDTFRAAAIEQLEIWAGRAQSDIIKHQQGSDPSAVLFDGVTAAVSRGSDVVLCDTAGRLHNKANLMEELKKVRRVVEKALPGAPHEVLLVLDATTGQNALAQAKVFNEAAPITGVALTKLDGTAKGGIVIAIANELKVPVKMVGVGEGVEDLQPFDPIEYVDGLFTESHTGGQV